MNSNSIDVYIYGYTGNEESLLDFAREFSGTKPYFIVSLPGFSDGKELTLEQQSDARAYSELVWQQIKKKAQDKSIRIIGHSHGAIITYCLAVAHENEIESVVLVCPVARPKMVVRITSKVLRSSVSVFGTERVLKVISRRVFVDAVTRRMRSKTWSKEGYKKIKTLRRREALLYNRTIIDCIQQIEPYRVHMHETYTQVPATILSTFDDKVAGKNDFVWYLSRLHNAKHVQVHGGHQCLVADPAGISDILRSNAVQ